MSDSEMITYEINDDLNEIQGMDLAQVQTKSNKDFNSQHSKNAEKTRISNLRNKSNKTNKQLLKKTPNLEVESHINNKLSKGKTVQNCLTAKNADSKHKNNFVININSRSSNKNSFNYSSNASSNQNFSVSKSNLISKNEKIKGSNNLNGNLNSCYNNINAVDKDLFVTESQGNFQVSNNFNNYNNFNTIGNFENEGFLSTKNKHASTFKMFENTNKSKNTHNNSLMRNYKKSSMELEKTKTISNNKTDYKTINSHMINNSKNTLIASSNERSSKFEVKLKDHINSLKSQKSFQPNPPIPYKETLVKKPFNNYLIPHAKETKIVSGSLSTAVNQKDFVITSTTNNKNKYPKTNSSQNLRLSLDPSNNSHNTKENKFIYKNEYTQTTKNNPDIKFLLSEKFKTSLDSSLKNNNKSFQSNFSKINKTHKKTSLISFDLRNQMENKRSLSIGERLYRKSIAYNNLKEKRVSIELSNRNMDIKANCSFKPLICEDSIMLSIKVKKIL